MRGLKLAKLRREIKAGLDDIAAGRTVDGGKAFAALRNRLKLRPAADDA
jgi:predicted transcriptional regulator